MDDFVKVKKHGTIRTANSNTTTPSSSSSSFSPSSHYQGSRIASYEMEVNIHNDDISTTNNDDSTSTTTNINNDNNDDNNKTTLMTKIVIELGASILHKGFHHVLQMIQNDETLSMGVPYTTGNDHVDTQISDPTSMGIYQGNGIWSILLTESTVPKYLRKYYLLLRYHWDLIKVNHICQRVQQQYNALPHLLNVTTDFFMDSPKDIWNTIQLYHPYVTTSFDEYLDTIGVSAYSSTTSSISIFYTIYRTIRNSISSIFYQLLPSITGSIRNELLSAINIVNYNQNNTLVSAMTGFGSFAAVSGDDTTTIFSIKGGNYQIITSAYRQAVQNRQQYCSTAATTSKIDTDIKTNSVQDHMNRSASSSSSSSTVQIIPKRIVTVVGDLDGLALFAENNEFVGEFDIVILAAPLQQSQIKFLIQSTLDPSIVQDMPLGGRINAHHKIVDSVIDDHHGHVQLPHPVPDSASRPYTQVVTTIVRDAFELNYEFFHLKDVAQLPRSILMTSEGQINTYNISAITLITKGIYKVFSNQPLESTMIQEIFGPLASIEYEHVWGGMYGGATPDYQAYRGSNTTNFLLYDGAFGLHGHTKSGALYYTNTMEQTALSCMEISAIGAKAVAKLIAERIGLLQERPRVPGSEWHDEL